MLHWQPAWGYSVSTCISGIEFEGHPQCDVCKLLCADGCVKVRAGGNQCKDLTLICIGPCELLELASLGLHVLWVLMSFTSEQPCSHLLRLVPS